jgi:hypothetical protein
MRYQVPVGVVPIDTSESLHDNYATRRVRPRVI